MSNNAEEQDVQVDEVVVLEKFDGEPTPENLVERIHIKNGLVIGQETIKNGRVISTRVVDPNEFAPGGTGPVSPRGSEPAKEVD